LNRLGFRVAVLTALTWAPAAWAQAPGEPSTSAPETAELPPPKRRARFFSTLQLGGGYFHATSGSSADRRRFSGGTVSGMLGFGGRVGRARQFAVGGAVLLDKVYGLRAHDAVIDGDEPHLDDVSFSLWALGFLADFAPDPELGLHFQGMAGLALISVSRPGSDPRYPFGLMGSLGVGYDLSVTKRLALGGLLRVTYAPLHVQDTPGTDVATLVPALLLTASLR
jgi:hypothetical protein